MSDVNALNQKLDELLAGSAAHGLAAAPRTGSPCDYWKTWRSSVIDLIGVLETIGVFVPQAIAAAKALKLIQSLLDSLCGVVSVPVAPSALTQRLDNAIRPYAASAPNASPCATWAQYRQDVIDVISELNKLSQSFPPLGKVAAVLSVLQGILDTLCNVTTPVAGGQCKVSLMSAAAGSGSAPAHRRARSYIKYPAPEKLRPRVGGPFKVADLCRSYDFPTGLAGGGVIGILELGGGFTPDDLRQFATLNGLPTTFTANAVPVNGGANSPGSEADGEVLLDIQVAAAAYFYCTGQLPTINVYFAPNASASFVAVIQKAMQDQCDVLSISWGMDEAGWSTADAYEVERAAAAATAAGCVIFASSGDNSSADSTLGANVDMPSSCPHIVGCGGTTKTPGFEKVWGDGTPSGEGTGGGYSYLFPRPTWQTSAPAIGGTRMVPDVSADADPNTGYLVVINGQQTPIGGTSAVAPLYSGLFASFGRKLGFVNPLLWSNEGAFQDIVSGSNGQFAAAPGPDPCTGLGVPKGRALAALFGAGS